MSDLNWKIQANEAGYTVKDYLQQVHQFSSRFLRSIKFDGGNILINGQEQKLYYELKTNDKLSVKFPPEKKGIYMKSEDLPLDIVYEDEHLLIINKPPHQVTMPNPFYQHGTVANALLGYYEKNNIPYTVHIVTRLDKETSGLMLIAKHRYCHSLLSLMQKEALIKRKYYAIIEGVLQEKQATIEAPIGREENSIIKRKVTAEGKCAVTIYHVLREIETDTLVDVQLKTGRTHQIRVHFSYLGHPLAGDDLYGGSKEKINRVALHCYQLSFTHPITKKEMLLEQDMPSDMTTLIGTNKRMV